MIQKPWSEAATIREVDNRDMKRYVLQLVLEREALREKVQELRTLVSKIAQIAQRVDEGEFSCYACSMSATGSCQPHNEVRQWRRQAMKDTVRHE